MRPIHLPLAQSARPTLVATPLLECVCSKRRGAMPPSVFRERFGRALARAIENYAEPVTRFFHDPHNHPQERDNGCADDRPSYVPRCEELPSSRFGRPQNADPEPAVV